MAFDFPSSPTNGQQYSPSGGPVYTYVNGLWLSSAGAAPVITSSATQTVAENSAFSMFLLATKTVTWTLFGGADASLFTISAGNNLTMAAKDFEAPIDANGDNVYVVTVKAIDALGNSAVQTINVTVTDVFEGVSNFVITDTHQQTADIAANPVTLSAKAIGSAGSGRIVLFCLQYTQAHTGRAIPIVKCDGAEMILMAMNNRASANTPCQIYALSKTTGTTADFEITFRTPDANPSVPRFNVFIVRIDSMHIAPADFTGASIGTAGTGANTLTLSAKADNGGMIIALGGQDAASAPPSEVWTGAVFDQTLSTETLRTQLAHYAPVANETLRTISYAVSGGGTVNVTASGACCLSMAPVAATRKFVWETFDRANAGLDASPVPTGYTNAGNWVASGSTPYLNINANRIENQNTAGTGCMHAFDVGSADMWAEWDVEVLASSGPFSCVRMIDSDNFIGIRASNTDIECYRRQAGSMNNVLTTTWDLSFGVLMRIEAEGTSLRLYRNGELMNTSTIAAPFLTPTKVGLIGRSVNYNGFLSRWRGGML